MHMQNARTSLLVQRTHEVSSPIGQCSYPKHVQNALLPWLVIHQQLLEILSLHRGAHCTRSGSAHPDLGGVGVENGLLDGGRGGAGGGAPHVVLAVVAQPGPAAALLPDDALLAPLARALHLARRDGCARGPAQQPLGS